MKVVSNINTGWFFKKIKPEMLLVIVLLVIGTILRIWQYAANRSLWLDECFLALNLIHRSFIGLTQPLDYGQAAPLGFLFIQKVVILILGNNEYSLRLFPLMAGILSLFLIYKTAQKYLQGTAVYIALVLFCFSSTLIYYSSENKQYASDVMFTLILLLAAHPFLEETAKRENVLQLALIGIISIWMSHPAVFVMTGIGIALIVRQAHDRNWRGFLQIVLICALWLISFALSYIISLRFTSANTMLTNHWSTSFMPVPPWRDWHWFSNTLAGSIQYPLALSFVTVSAILLFVGCISISLRRWTTGLVLILTIMTTLAASGLQKYPFSGRLILFLVPIGFLLIAAGIDQSQTFLNKYSRFVGLLVSAILIVLLLVKPINVAIEGFKNPEMREHIRPVIEYIKQNKQDNDVIYLHYNSFIPFRYYAPFFGFKDGDYRVGIKARFSPEKYWADIETLKGKNRVWFLFAHLHSKNIVNERLHYLIHLDKIGKKIDEFSAPGAVVYLYDLRGKGTIRQRTI